MEGCLLRAVRMLGLFIVLVCLVLTADCVAGIALNIYWPTWEEDLSTWEEPLSRPNATPETRVDVNAGRAAAEARLDRSARQRIQLRLQDEGFDPGAADGVFGPRTRAAIRDWQRSRRAPQTGYLNGTQALELTDSAEPAAAGINRNDGVRSEFFTRGSHGDEVLRIQGTPTRIRTFGESELWWYGLSSVTIATRTGQVTEWSNVEGNLRVQLTPTTAGPPDRQPTPAIEPESDIYSASDTGIVNPRLLREIRPQYTAGALRAKITGSVYLEMVVLPDGSVGDVRITKSLDGVHGLDEEAVKAARQWLFEPGTRSGVPVPVVVNLALDFNLR